MAQHFLLSAAARTLKLKDIYRMSDDQAFGKNFSATSRTIFASRKMAFVDLLAAICIFVNAAKGISALQLSRDLSCQYKTAFVLGPVPIKRIPLRRRL